MYQKIIVFLLLNQILLCYDGFSSSINNTDEEVIDTSSKKSPIFIIETINGDKEYPLENIKNAGYSFISYLDKYDNFFDEKRLRENQFSSKTRYTDEDSKNLLEKAKNQNICAQDIEEDSSIILLDSANDSGNTVLHFATTLGNESLIEAIKKKVLSFSNTVAPEIEKKYKNLRFRNYVMGWENNQKQTAYDIALEKGNIKIISIFTPYLDVNQRDSMCNKAKELCVAESSKRENIIKLLGDLCLSDKEEHINNFKQAVNPYSQIVAYLESLKKDPVPFGKYFQGFYTSEKGLEKEYERMKKSSERFFRRKKAEGRIITNLSKYPKRTKILYHKELTDKNIDSISPHNLELESGEMKFSFEWKTTQGQPANQRLQSIGAYEGEISKIQLIEAKKEYTDYLKPLLIKSVKTGYPLYRLVSEKDQEDAKYLDRISALLDFEITRRMHKKNDNYDEISAVGVALARFYSLFENGKLSLSDLCDESSGYHPFTGNVVSRKDAIKKINHIYKEDVETHLIDSESEKIKEWKRNNPYGILIKTQEGLHQELLDYFGGGYESSGDEYLTDG